MKEYSILQLQNYVDLGGSYELQHHKSTIVHKEETYTYIASGLSRDVFVSTDGKWVLKIPQKFDSWGFEHNKLEVDCYNEAPDWCKTHVAESYLTEEGYVLQEFLNVHYIGDAYWRELGYREDETCVIFDCDILLSNDWTRPKSGFKYEEVFGARKGMFGNCYEIVETIQKERKRSQRITAKKHFPGLFDGTQSYSTSCGYGGQKVTIYNVIGKDENGRPILDEGFNTSLELALECGFIDEIDDED